MRVSFCPSRAGWQAPAGGFVGGSVEKGSWLLLLALKLGYLALSGSLLGAGLAVQWFGYT